MPNSMSANYSQTNGERKYVGHNLENVDKLKTVGGSVGISSSGINSIGINYRDRKQEEITRNTVIGNVEIGKSSGDDIYKEIIASSQRFKRCSK